jgi:hypothetical protein
MWQTSLRKKTYRLNWLFFELSRSKEILTGKFTENNIVSIVTKLLAARSRV